MKRISLLLALLLAACGQPSPSPAPPYTPTINAIDYLGQIAPVPRYDWPLPNGYVSVTNQRTGPTTATQTWDFIDPNNKGDGFQTAEVQSDGWITFPSTQDGGTPWVQHFVGRRCGGTGWLVFKNDAASGQWKSAVARLSISQDPNACPPLGTAFTRYRLEQVAFPFSLYGVLSTLTLKTVISEHYSGDSLEGATALERSYLSDGYGLMRWEAWSATPPVITDLPERCKQVEYSVAPKPGWYMNDCRTYSIIKAQP